MADVRLENNGEITGEQFRYVFGKRIQGYHDTVFALQTFSGRYIKSGMTRYKNSKSPHHLTEMPSKNSFLPRNIAQSLKKKLLNYVEITVK